jgi:hypothetical protein
VVAIDLTGLTATEELSKTLRAIESGARNNRAYRYPQRFLELALRSPPILQTRFT